MKTRWLVLIGVSNVAFALMATDPVLANWSWAAVGYCLAAILYQEPPSTSDERRL